MFTVEAMVRGYHCYQEIWEAVLGEQLQSEREPGNIHDIFAVAVLKSGVKVGHLPRKISAVCSLFLRNGGVITCTVSGARRYSVDLEQGGLEIPCTLRFEGNEKLDNNYLNKVERLVRSAMSSTAKRPDSVASKTDERMDSTGSNPEPKKRKLADFSNKEQRQTDSWELEIKNGEMLTNVSVSMAQNMIHNQFPSLNGLKPTMDQYYKQPADSGKNQLQIFHCRDRAHWIVASSVGCMDDISVNIYDSVFNSLDKSTIDVITNHFPAHSIKMQPLQKQLGGKDCGLFAIAVIAAISYGQDPSKLRFVQKEMRSHLLNCLKGTCITPFPCKD